MKLLGEALFKFGMGLVCLGLLLFLPAGTIEYPGAWLLIGILFVLNWFFVLPDMDAMLP